MNTINLRTVVSPLWVGLFAAVILNSCGTSESKPKNEAAKATAPPALPAFSLEKGQLSSSLRIPGEMIAFQQVDLYAKVNSFVKKLYVDVGSTVAAGQLLATMEAPEINSQLSGAESRLKSQEAIYLASKANYDRLYETSLTPGTVSQNDLDLAFARQKSDLAQLQAAKAAHKEIGDNRNYLEIRAPFGGIISSRNVSAGAYVGPSGKGSEFPLFTLQEQRKLRLVISVPESYSSYLNNQSEVKFTVKSLPGQPFTAKVTRLSGALDGRLHAQRVEMDVLNDSKQLLPGMVAEVEIPLAGSDSAFVVPSSAVVTTSEKTLVIRINQQKAEWVEVKKGREAEGKAEVFGPLQQGDVILETANEEVRNGSDVKQVKLKKD